MTIDNIVGKYTGKHTHRNIDYAYAMGQTYYMDTTYITTDTLFIEKNGNDSFKLTSPAWYINNQPVVFAFNADNVYTFNGVMTSGTTDTISIRFDASKDSISISKYQLIPGTSAYHKYANEFHGKK